MRSALLGVAVGAALAGCCDPHVIGNAVCKTNRSLKEFQRTGSTERFLEHWRSVDAAPATATCTTTLEWALEHPASLEPFLAALPQAEREWFLCVAAGVSGDGDLHEDLLAAFETDTGEHVARFVHYLRLERDRDTDALRAACSEAWAQLQASKDGSEATTAGVVGALGPSFSEFQDDEPAATTLEMQRQLRDELTDRRDTLDEYRAEVRRLHAGGTPEEAAVLAAFEDAERAWESFVSADRAAATASHGEGSLRQVAGLAAELAHVEARTEALWERYLGGAATDLPEPAPSPATGSSRQSR